MAARASALLLLGASAIMAGPIAVRDTTVATTANVQAVVGTTTWNVGAVDSFPIHGSCNVTQRVMLERGFNEAIALARHARDHILRWGHDSEIYTKYFGKAPTGEPIGWYTKIADGDKAGILFRCDDIDGNCSQDGKQPRFHLNHDGLLTDIRLGWSLAWIQRHIGDCDL